MPARSDAAGGCGGPPEGRTRGRCSGMAVGGERPGRRAALAGRRPGGSRWAARRRQWHRWSARTVPRFAWRRQPYARIAERRRCPGADEWTGSAAP